jgi:hypothetical protein
MACCLGFAIFVVPKLGLVFGLGILVAVAVVTERREPDEIA